MAFYELYCEQRLRLYRTREWTSREMTNLEWRAYSYDPPFCSREHSNRHRGIPFVHLHLNTVTLRELSHYQGLLIQMKTDFLAILLLDDIVAIIDAHQFSLDHLGLREAAHPSLLSRRLGQPEAQQHSTRQDTGDFGNREHARLLG